MLLESRKSLNPSSLISSNFQRSPCGDRRALRGGDRHWDTAGRSCSEPGGAESIDEHPCHREVGFVPNCHQPAQAVTVVSAADSLGWLLWLSPLSSGHWQMCPGDSAWCPHSSSRSLLC